MAIFAFAESIQLVPDFTMLLHIAMILVMIWILNRTFFKPINRVLKTRERSEGGHSAEAGEILRTVEEKEAEYRASMLEARNEGYEIIEKEREAALARKRQEMEKAKEETSAYLAKELGRVEKETADAEQEIREQAEQMAEKITASIIKAA